MREKNFPFRFDNEVTFDILRCVIDKPVKFSIVCANGLNYQIGKCDGPEGGLGLGISSRSAHLSKRLVQGTFLV